MTKPVAEFRSGVILGDSRCTARFDENRHLVLFPSFSRYITSWAISATWPVEASRSRCYRPGSGIWVYGWLLVGHHVSVVSRPGRVGHSDPQRPSTGSIWRFISCTTGGVGFCPLDRAVGVNPGFFLRNMMRLEVPFPQYQTAMYETYN
jgi:hypothetical protein